MTSPLPQTLSAVQPEAEEIVDQLRALCEQVFGDQLQTLLIHGSATKGGIIPGSSDLDFVMFVEPDLLTAGNELPFERAVAFHAALAEIDPEPFLYLQGLIQSRANPKHIGFIPGTYFVVAGSHEVPLASSDTLFKAAESALASFDVAQYRDDRSKALLNHGETRLFRQLRYMCTDIWPMAFHIACLIDGDGIRAWQRTKHQTVKFLAGDPIVGTPLKRWLETVTDHYAGGETTATALEALAVGITFLDATSHWYRNWSAAGSTLPSRAVHNAGNVTRKGG